MFLKIPRLASRKSYLVICSPNSHANLIKSEIRSRYYLPQFGFIYIWIRYEYWCPSYVKHKPWACGGGDDLQTKNIISTFAHNKHIISQAIIFNRSLLFVLISHWNWPSVKEPWQRVPIVCLDFSLGLIFFNTPMTGSGTQYSILQCDLWISTWTYMMMHEGYMSFLLSCLWW